MIPEGIITKDGVLHEVDVIIYATGFQASEFLEPMKITGLNGMDLHEYWGGDAKAFAGLTVPNFPNLFIITGPNTGHVVNGSLYSMIEYGVEYILESLRIVLEEGPQGPGPEAGSPRRVRRGPRRSQRHQGLGPSQRAHLVQEQVRPCLPDLAPPGAGLLEDHPQAVNLDDYNQLA